MPWARIDDTFYDHPKVMQTSLAALGLHMKALSYCNRHLTDGQLPTVAIAHLGGTAKLAGELVANGLWEQRSKGYVIHDYLRYSKSRSDVESARKRWADSKRQSRADSTEDSDVDSTQDSAESQTAPFPLPSPVPVPAPVGVLSKAPTASATPPAAKPKSRRDVDEPRLSKEQYEAWKSFGPEWNAVKTAWLGRGFLYPPAGSAEDDDTSQRGLLFQLLDNWPGALPGWIAEAHGTSPREVIDWCLAKWHDIRDEVPFDEERERAPSRTNGMTSLGDVLRALP